MQKRITANFTADHIGFKESFDCTDQVLKLSQNELLKLEDYDTSSDQLAPETLIEESRLLFQDMWGDGFKNVEFGYGVRVVESILNYFNVEKLEDIHL